MTSQPRHYKCEAGRRGGEQGGGVCAQERAGEGGEARQGALRPTSQILQQNAANFFEARSELPPTPALRGIPSLKGAASRAGHLYCDPG